MKHTDCSMILSWLKAVWQHWGSYLVFACLLVLMIVLTISPRMPYPWS
ncbi:MAG TPA: hypothetical protein VFA09_04190 [Ktedonobacteraceae bacterium]|nr:hypothetical protein [Ktedonobacteraceae bacterium]